MRGQLDVPDCEVPKDPPAEVAQRRSNVVPPDQELCERFLDLLDISREAMVGYPPKIVVPFHTNLY